MLLLQSYQYITVCKIITRSQIFVKVCIEKYDFSCWGDKVVGQVSSDLMHLKTD